MFVSLYFNNKAFDVVNALLNNDASALKVSVQFELMRWVSVLNTDGISLDDDPCSSDLRTLKQVLPRRF
jgi:hypothetical protein